MTAVTYPKYTAPQGWTNLTAQTGYTALVGLNVQVICDSGGGAIVWGGATAPTTPYAGAQLTSESTDSETAVAQVWLKGPATYTVIQR